MTNTSVLSFLAVACCILASTQLLAMQPSRTYSSEETRIFYGGRFWSRHGCDFFRFWGYDCRPVNNRSTTRISQSSPGPTRTSPSGQTRVTNGGGALTTRTSLGAQTVLSTTPTEIFQSGILTYPEMTEPYQTQISSAVTDGLAMLSNKMKTEIPHPVPDVATLQTLKRQADKMITKVNFVIAQIEEGQHNWLKVQCSLSVNERTADLEIHKKFINDTNFPANLYKFRAYVCDLSIFKEDIENILNPPTPVVAPPNRKAPSRLPPPTLPIFSGNIEEWPVFWQRYKNLIHDVDSMELADSSKMDILLNECLKDKARRAVAHFSLDESQYPKIISYLKSEFGNDLALKESLIHSLRTLKPTTGKRDDLRRFVDELEQICSRLERAGENPETLSTQTLIMTKLPNFLQEHLLVARHNLPSNQAWTTLKMRECLKEKVLAATAAATVNNTASESLSQISAAAGGLAQNDPIVSDATSRNAQNAMDSAVTTANAACVAAGANQTAINAANAAAVTSINAAQAAAATSITAARDAAITAIQAN
ncbi:hypothetical protein DdX_11031 [Ditylenchus destructor]|uniref:Uncharacterized protein n=1 Tax=Ditylenchus destructor TaxID=166010 RepID=A0AAD4QYR6_9BILA|nr:hypothetical protein DdX_11031 [Ditylenchus destructor]